MNHLGQPVGEPLPGWAPPPHPGTVAMRGRFCTVEPIAERFAADLFDANSQDGDGRTWTYLAYGPFASGEDYRRWLKGTCLGPDPLFYAIVDARRGRPAGVAAFMRIQPAAGSIEIGHVHFSPGLQRTPAATEALFLMIQRAFALGYRRCEWKCDALNAASRAAAVRLGFTFEGIFRQATVYKGRNRDTAWFSIVDGEWPVLAEAFEAWLAAGNFDEHGRQKASLRELTSRARASRER